MKKELFWFRFFWFLKQTFGWIMLFLVFALIAYLYNPDPLFVLGALAFLCFMIIFGAQDIFFTLPDKHKREREEEIRKKHNKGKPWYL